jgi:hypothetical protein
MSKHIGEYKAYSRERRALRRDRETIRNLTFRNSRDVSAQKTIAVISRAIVSKDSDWRAR